MALTLHPLGIALAAVFVASMACLFFWMFRVPRQVPHEVAAVRHSVAALQRILVPVSGKVASGRAVELACRLGAAQKAEIVLAYVLEVPFTLSLDTSLPQEEARGRQALDVARLIVEQHGLPVRSKIMPHRYAWGGILHLAKEEQADAIIMGIGAGRPGLSEGLGRTCQEIVQRAPCEVIIDRVPGRL
ncbi:MAG TPA: universal stress protein [Anaerolineae bacterium]|nr:universal stress protein [Anaerolineae bacterium]HOR00795.1 universal stress protein [Anaerolineae bacterium]HPL29761.1 universal stress protein [Anaerolineae bacterium]